MQPNANTEGDRGPGIGAWHNNLINLEVSLLMTGYLTSTILWRNLSCALVVNLENAPEGSKIPRLMDVR